MNEENTMQEINYKEEYYNLRRQISELNDDLVGLIDDIDESYGCVCSAPYGKIGVMAKAPKFALM